MATNQHGWYTANERAQYVQDFFIIRFIIN